MPQNALLIFAKYPEPGKVKIRLYPAISHENAAKLCEIMIEETIATHLDNDLYDLIIYCDPPDKRKYFKSITNNTLNVKHQRGAGLGERMANALDETLRAGYNKAAVIGTDCPGISSTDILTAFSKLDKSDYVLGPAEDGGYYLVGACNIDPGIFKDVDWSTEKVFEQTLNNIKTLGYSCNMIDKKYDIDTYRDVQRLFEDLNNNSISSNNTRLKNTLRSILGAK